MKFRYTLEIEFKNGSLMENISFLKTLINPPDKERAEISVINIEEITDKETKRS
jgi:hypothetical protein